MKLLELHINGFGKIHDRTISFADGVNVIYGRNEAGKSTLHTFIRGMLFGMERGRGRAARNDLYSKYEPWENSGTYEGWLRLEQGGVIYRIERRFRRDDRYLRVINETQGREEEPTRALMDQILGGLNETTYNNTISISQLKSATEDGMVGELKNYIANMNTTGNISLNITKATAFLKSQKRSLEANLVPDASREYTALLAEIRAVDAEISSPQYENQLASYQTMRSRVKGIIENTQAERAALAEQVKRSRQVLAEGQFTDRSSVAACEEKARDLYDSFCTAERECTKRSRKLLAAAGLLLAVCGGLTAGYLGIMDLFRFLPLVVAAGGAAVLCLILAVVLTARGKRFGRKMEEDRAQLSELLGRHLGDGTVSSAAMDAFYGRMAEFSRLCDMLDQSEHALDKYAEDINSLQEKQNSCSEMIEQQQRTQWELEKKLEHLNACRTRAAALKRVLAENDRVREEILAIEMAQETMTELSSSIRDSFGLYLNKEASRLVSGITGGIYDSMSIDENLNVFLNTKSRLVPLENVSSGAMDQVYLALRLAAARLLQGDGEPFPLIFDDSFTLYDDDRLRTALKWLSKAYDGQLIIFTCHRREAQMLRALQTEFQMVEI